MQRLFQVLQHMPRAVRQGVEAVLGQVRAIAPEHVPRSDIDRQEQDDGERDRPGDQA
jgi:hypothetical protein